MSQLDAIRRHLDAGRTLTPLEALRRFGCLRLAARICDLRSRGYPVSSRVANKRGKRVAEYWRSSRG